MGYVWSDGYVWDMSGVRYANNLLKNPATKHLSGNSCSIGYGAKKLDHTLARKNDSPTWCGVIVVVWCYCGGVVLLW